MAIWLRPVKKFDIHGSHAVHGLGLQSEYFEVVFLVVGEFGTGGTCFTLENERSLPPVMARKDPFGSGSEALEMICDCADGLIASSEGWVPFRRL